MPKVDVQLETPVDQSFRVQQIGGMFDVPLTEKMSLSFSVQVPAPTDDPFGEWHIGAIVGPSGSGKTSVARAAFARNFVTGFSWPRRQSILDGFPAALSIKEITETLTSVGFSSPPQWVLPYRALSTGQRFRTDLARAILRDVSVVAYDEFTSVVDRQVGRFASAAIAKTIRKGRAKAARFVAVTCHYDVLEWLEPDWILDMSRRELARGSLQRPEIRVEVQRAHGPSSWPLFRPHHYLSSKLHPGAWCYLATWDQVPVAFLATIANAGHAKSRIGHRVVVLPDYQGLGIGIRLIETVARHEGQRHRFSFRTSHPAIITVMRGRPGWHVTGVERFGRVQPGYLREEHRRVGSVGRSTVGFEWRPQDAPS